MAYTDQSNAGHPGRRLRLGFVLVAAVGLAAQTLEPGPPAAAPELEALRQLGKAYYENDDFKTAAQQFLEATLQAPSSAADQFNLGLSRMRAEAYPEALAALARAEQLDAGLLAVHYLRGIIHKRRGEYELAIASLRRVVAEDPQCVGAYYNLAHCYKASEQPTRAIATLEAALSLDPQNPSCHYQLLTLYRRLGDVEQAARHAEIFERVKDTVGEAEKTIEALERSRYSDIIVVSPPPAGHAQTAASTVPVRFVEVTATAGLTPPKPLPPLTPPPRHLDRAGYRPEAAVRSAVPWVGGSVAVGDYNGDGRPDLYFVDCRGEAEASANRLYRNEGDWRFTDVTGQAGVGDRGLGTHAVFGDYDNDGHLDLYVVNHGPNVLYRNRGDGTFDDVSAAAHADEPLAGRRAVFVDYDHDHDLDLFIANDADLAAPAQRDRLALPEDFPGEPNTLLRNNGNGTFADQTDEAGLLVALAQTRDVVAADFDGDHDIDLLAVNFNDRSTLFLNRRLGRFAVGGSFAPPLEAGARAVAEADFNRDGHADLLVAIGTDLRLYRNDGQANFQAATLPGFASTSAPGVARLRVFDANNDGWPDVLWTEAEGGGVHLLMGAGLNRMRGETARAGLDQVGGHIADFAAADLDGDGDLDLVLQSRERGPVLLRNDSRNQQHWLALRLRGRKVNRSGYGATVEIAASGHYQRQTAREDVVHFGLGALTQVQAVRVTWPNGMAQNVIQPGMDQTIEVEEYVKVSASCAFLWADGGAGFELINEVLGIGPLGVPMAPGQYFPLDCTELTKIEPDRLRPQDGSYELRLTEDLREIAFVDAVQLRVIDHPAELEVVPNEMFTAPPFPEDKFFALADGRPPRSAVDDRGQDVRELIARRDGRYPTFPVTRYDGLAQPHSLTLDLGDLAAARQILLCLDGWIYWADSSVSWGIFQNPDCISLPLTLEVRDERGHWHTAIGSVGLPTSKGSVVPVDLTGTFLCRDWTVRLSTTLCIYFDRIFVATQDRASECRTTVLPVSEADLHFRGFARMHRDALGFERFEYAAVSLYGSWDPPRGMFTRYGAVTSLLDRPDDRYVVFGPGDELTLRFTAAALPGLPEGWRRSFVFDANGWVKDGDLNTKFSETVEPLPFHGMSGYPYPASEHYPDSPAHRDYLRTYQTRPSQPTTGDLKKLMY